MKAARIVLGVLGGAMIVYGAARLLHSLPTPMLGVLGVWLLGALVVHLGVLSPAVLAIGAALTGLPDRARGFVQAGLIMAGAVTIIALPLIIRQFSQPPAKAMLLQQYGANLAVLLGVIAVGTLVAYAVRVARDRHGSPDPTR